MNITEKYKKHVTLLKQENCKKKPQKAVEYTPFSFMLLSLVGCYSFIIITTLL